jgi:hypothetical protein
MAYAATARVDMAALPPGGKGVQTYRIKFSGLSTSGLSSEVLVRTPFSTSLSDASDKSVFDHSYALHNRMRAAVKTDPRGAYSACLLIQ